MKLTEKEESQRQILAAELFLTMEPKEIRQWLNDQQDKDYKQDMRNRLNQLKELRRQENATFKTAH